MRKLLLVAGLPLAIFSLFLVSQEPHLWWVLLWLPVAVLRWVSRRTLREPAMFRDPKDVLAPTPSPHEAKVGAAPGPSDEATP